jgi:murein L,D-transpeptidase YcbB/YkuD
MYVGGHNRRALRILCVLVAGRIASAVALEGPVDHSVPKTAFRTAGGSPLFEVIGRTPSVLALPELGVFDRLGNSADNSPVVVATGAVERIWQVVGQAPLGPFPTRTASPPPAPVPTAVAAAVARLIVGSSYNPLGAGDWQAARAAIGAFYAARSFEPVWIDGNGLTRTGSAALRQIERAGEDGLDLSRLSLPKQVAAGLAPDDRAKEEVRIAVAVVAYAEQASGSRIAPSRISPIIGAAPSVADPLLALTETAAAADPGARLAAFNPPQKGYRELREELKRLTDSRPGRRAPLDPNDGPVESRDVVVVPDPDLEAPRAWRNSRRSRAHAAYADRFTRGAQARKRAEILANMEMWRWEPRDMGVRRIEVNIPGFSVELLEGDTVVHNARVIVGKRQTPTPIFSDVMRYVLINPAWQLPDSIVKKEILPRLAHFERLGYEVKTVGGRLTVRQPPGEDNALGRLAFMFPNDHSVYLHDTPARELFSANMRALSHGCVRVEDPIRIAEFVLGWSESRIDAAIGGHERTVFLPSPLPIHIEYFTDFVDEDGILQERPDVYGLTQKVADTLPADRQD